MQFLRSIWPASELASQAQVTVGLFPRVTDSAAVVAIDIERDQGIASTLNLHLNLN
jgi:hypothetical protein